MNNIWCYMEIDGDCYNNEMHKCKLSASFIAIPNSNFGGRGGGWLAKTQCNYCLEAGRQKTLVIHMMTYICVIGNHLDIVQNAWPVTTVSCIIPLYSEDLQIFFYYNNWHFTAAPYTGSGAYVCFSKHSFYYKINTSNVLCFRTNRKHKHQASKFICHSIPHQWFPHLPHLSTHPSPAYSSWYPIHQPKQHEVILSFF